MLQKNNHSVRFRLAFAWALAFHVPASQAERADREQPIRLEAAQVSIDDAKQISTFLGNVLLTQGTMTIHGDKLVITQDKNGMQHGIAYGQPASFRQKREGHDEYVEGYGERIEYDSKNETVDFFGQARMQRGHDEVRGDHITYNSRTEIFQALGTPDREGNRNADTGSKSRVRVIIQPRNKPVPSSPADESLPIKPAATMTQPELNQ